MITEPTELGTFTSTFRALELEKPDILEFGTQLYEEVKGCPNMDQIKKSYDLYIYGVDDSSIIETQARRTKATILIAADIHEF